MFRRKKRRLQDEEHLKALEIAASYYNSVTYRQANMLDDDTDFLVELEGKQYHVEVDVLEREPDYVRLVLVLSGDTLWRNFFPYSTGVIVYREGRETRTEFQLKCEEELSAVLSRFGKSLEDRRMEGKTETYIHGRISDSDIEICIYEDEAEFFGDRVDCRFESPDYDTGEELMAAFLKELASVLSKESDTSAAG